MRLTPILAALLCALLLAPSLLAARETRELVPGVTYTRETKRVGGRQVVLHIVIAPRPGGLYELAPVLGGSSVTSRDTLTGMQRRIAPRATVVGVNGDLYSFAEGYPTGIFLRGGVMHARPTSARSTLGIGSDGTLRVDRVGFFGLVGLGESKRQRLDQFNRPLNGGQIGLFTDRWGATTPGRKGALELVLGGVPASGPNLDLGGQVVEVRNGGGGPIPAGGAVLQATGADAAALRGTVQPGTSVFLRLNLNPWWPEVADAIGGGPALIRNGQIALPTNEQFTKDQIGGRHPRTAAGQLADGRIVLIAVDGRSSRSAGMRLLDLARELRALGAVTAMAFDGGGGTTMAFDGTLLNAPSDGSQRAVANALMVHYLGAYAPPPSASVVSPNGDGVADGQRLAYKIVRPSTVDVRLIGPGGGTLMRESGPREPGTYDVVPELDGRPDGRWRWLVTAVDDQNNPSQHERTFAVNSTLGFLELSKRRMVVTRRGGSLVIGFRLARNARVSVTIENRKGRTVRTLLAGPRKRGAVDLNWNGRRADGKLVPRGRYVVVVEASNRFGDVDLTEAVVVRRR